MPPLTDDQLAERQHYLGGTDMAALAGVSRWGTAATVFGDKRPDLWAPAARTTSPMMALGNLIEPIVASLVAEATGLTVRQPRRHPSPWVDGRSTTAIQCPYHPWEGANLDRLASEEGGYGGLIECKWGESRRRWGDMTASLQTPWHDHPAAVPPTIPEDYYVQVQHYLHVTRRSWAIIGLLLGYAEFRFYRVDANYVLHGALVDLGTEFWHTHVLPGLPPAPDGSGAYEARIRAAWPKDDGLQRPATPTEATTLQQLHVVQTDLAAMTKEEARLKQVLMDSMGTTTRIDAPGASVSWKTNRDSASVKWELVARDAMRLALPDVEDTAIDNALQPLTRARTITSPGARPFRVTFSDDEEE